jgi:hypothetical protein
MEDFEEIRDEHLVPTYAHVARAIDEVDQNLTQKDTAELRAMVNERYSATALYDPHPVVSKLDSIWQTIKSVLTVIFGILFLFGMVLAHQSLTTLAKDGLSLVDVLQGLLPISVVVVLGVGVRVMRADTFIHQTLNRHLRAVRGQLYIRERNQLVGYAIWNDSLQGQSGLVLLTLLYLLKSLSSFPIIGRWFEAPHRTALEMTRRHAEDIYECESKREVIQTLYRAWKTD